METTVRNMAIFSRIIVLSLILLWRTLLSPYDTSAQIDPACLSPSNDHDLPTEKLLWSSMASLIESSVVWDGVYFVRIAKCGYEYEQTYAFLPLLPLCISGFTHTVFAPLTLIIGRRAVLALSGYVINNIAFVFAAIYFYKLSVTVLKDRDAALRASILFCFNPASIFYSSIYSESLYALLSIGGVYHLISGKDNIAVLWLALSGLARSNGVINAGYICFQTLHRSYNARLGKKAYILAGGVVRCLCIFAPFMAFQAYGYYSICVGSSPNKLRPWCTAKIPLLYNYIQSHYWNVGFLRYFQLKQLPNFLLASPILSLAVWSLFHYAKSEPRKFFSVGFHASMEDKKAAAVFFIPEPGSKANIKYRPRKLSSTMNVLLQNPSPNQNEKLIERKDGGQRAEKYESSDKNGYFSVFVLPFVLHLGFLAATAFFVMHVQVATRFLSSSPPLYWFAAQLMRSHGGERWGYMIWAYSTAYVLLGSLLFSNFYPFT